MPNNPVQKQYVGVWAFFDPDGSISPTKIEWPDGTRFEIDRVLKAERRASAYGGSITMRYEVQIMGHRRYLFREVASERWFVEVPGA